MKQLFRHLVREPDTYRIRDLPDNLGTIKRVNTATYTFIGSLVETKEYLQVVRNFFHNEQIKNSVNYLNNEIHDIFVSF